MVDTAPVTELDFTVAEMEAQVARFKHQKSSDKAFIDTRIPGHEREIFSIIGNGIGGIINLIICQWNCFFIVPLLSYLICPAADCAADCVLQLARPQLPT